MPEKVQVSLDTLQTVILMLEDSIPQKNTYKEVVAAISKLIGEIKHSQQQSMKNQEAQNPEDKKKLQIVEDKEDKAHQDVKKPS